MKKNQKVILWSVDPFDSDTKPSAQAVRELARWVKGMGLNLQPVFIMPLPMESIERGSLKAVDEAQNLLDDFVAEYGVPGILPATLILDNAGTRQGAVNELLAYARKAGAASIALSSHGRAGLKRFVLGSFAEQVLRDSPVPVLFLSKQNPAMKGSTVLFSTDFSTNSRKAFRKFLEFAAPLKLQVELFHAVALPAPVLESAGAAAPSVFIPENYFPNEEAKARKEGEAWIRLAAEAGVKAKLRLSDRSIGMLSGETILKAADKAKAFLIALSTQSQPFEHFVFGSAAMDVFRASRYPVWICGPRALGGAASGASKKTIRYAPAKAVGRRAASRSRSGGARARQ